MLQNWSEKLGIPAYACPAKPAKAQKPTQTANQKHCMVGLKLFSWRF